MCGLCNICLHILSCPLMCVYVRAYVVRIGGAGRHHMWRVVWFLLLLFYAPLLHTCTAILKCRSTPSATGREEALVSVIIMISVTSL